jgi:TonB family protein
MRAFYPIVILAGMVLAWQPVNAAKPPLIYAPTIPWNLNYADDSCVLRRSFGDKKHEILLEFRQFSPGDGFEVTMASEHVSLRDGPTKTRFLPDENPRSIGIPLRLSFPGNLVAARWSESFFENDKPKATAEEMAGKPLPQHDEPTYKARESAIRGLEISSLFGPPIVLQTGEMHRPMSAMRKCLDELVTHWGIDAAAQKTLTRRPRPVDQIKWARAIQARYPGAMLNAGRSGRVLIRLIVGADGKPTSCNIQSIVEDSSFGKTACERMMLATRFDPALDAAGRPIASYFHTNVIYTIN